MSSKSQKVIIIGGGFSSLSASCYLARLGYDVTILEKNDSIGGRARQFSESGFTFDMGPSWYWMPDVFDSFFEHFGKKVSDYYELERLDPSYQVVYGPGDEMVIPADMGELEALFNSIEPGAGEKLREFLKQAAYKYEVGINKLVHKPGESITEFVSLKLLLDVLRMDVFKSMTSHVKQYFKHPRLVQLMEFPVLFLGALAEKTPALYSLMNYADMSLGTWYPKGGMFNIVSAMESLAKELGVNILTSHEVSSVNNVGNQVKSVSTSKYGDFQCDILLAGADYHHVDTKLVAPDKRNYSDGYWDKRVMAPSSLLYYVGLNRKLDKCLHHNLFFDTDFAPHAKDIYENPRWPKNPLFYASVTSKTDDTVAPEGHENLFLLIPVAPGLKEDESIREKYFDIIIKRMEDYVGHDIKSHIVYKRSFAHKDFKTDYNSFKGNAYGLANTLKQTAILKPSLRSKKLKNMYHTGQLTVPGPGVPPSLISGKVVSELINKYHN